MERLLVKLMFLGAAAQLGLSAKDLLNPWQTRKATRQVLTIDWKPIGLFPKEAARFR
jgi:hypothetical protein